MTSFVDTNVLIRHLTNDPPAMARRATAFLRVEDRLLLTDLIVAETVHVLGSVYEANRAEIAVAMRSLLELRSIVVADRDLLLRALDVYEHHRIDFPDAYLAACAEMTGVPRIASFDKSLDRVTTIDRVEP